MRDIAILRTMGASRHGLIKIFVTVGVTIGALGTCAGIVVGFTFLFFRQHVVEFVQFLTGQNLWDPSIRFLTELPAKADPVEITTICLMALLFSFLARSEEHTSELQALMRISYAVFCFYNKQQK